MAKASAIKWIRRAAIKKLLENRLEVFNWWQITKPLSKHIADFTYKPEHVRRWFVDDTLNLT